MKTISACKNLDMLLLPPLKSFYVKDISSSCQNHNMYVKGDRENSYINPRSQTSRLPREHLCGTPAAAARLAPPNQLDRPHGVLFRPGARGLLELGHIAAHFIRDLEDQGVRRVRLREQGRDRQEQTGCVENRSPLGLEDVETDAAGAVDVAMINFKERKGSQQR